MSERTEALAEALEEDRVHSRSLSAIFTDEQWQTPLPHAGRKVGVVVHHVGMVYPLE